MATLPNMHIADFRSKVLGHRPASNMEMLAAVERAERGKSAFTRIANSNSKDGDLFGELEAECLASRRAMMELASELLGVDARRIVEAVL